MEDVQKYRNYSEDELDQLGYRVLQKITKALNLPSNVKKINLVELIIAKFHKSHDEVEQIIHRVRYERQLLSQQNKRKGSRKMKVQAKEISSTSNPPVSPPIDSTPKRHSPDMQYYRSLLRYKTRAPTPRATSDRVLRSYNVKTYKRPNYSLLNDALMGLVNVSERSSSPKQMQICVISEQERPSISARNIKKQRSAPNMGKAEAIMCKEPTVVTAATQTSATNTRGRFLSNVGSSQHKQLKTNYEIKQSIGFRHTDGKLSKVNALVQRPDPQNIYNFETPSYRNVEVTIQDLINSNIDSQTFTNTNVSAYTVTESTTGSYPTVALSDIMPRGPRVVNTETAAKFSVYYHKKITETVQTKTCVLPPMPKKLPSLRQWRPFNESKKKYAALQDAPAKYNFMQQLYIHDDPQTSRNRNFTKMAIDSNHDALMCDNNVVKKPANSSSDIAEYCDNRKSQSIDIKCDIAQPNRKNSDINDTTDEKRDIDNNIQKNSDVNEKIEDNREITRMINEIHNENQNIHKIRNITRNICEKLHITKNIHKKHDINRNTHENLDITQNTHEIRETNKNMHGNRDITQNIPKVRDTNQNIHKNRDKTQNIPKVRDTNQNIHKNRDITLNIPEVRDTNQNIHKNRDITQNIPEVRDTNQNIHKNRDITQNTHDVRDTNQNIHKNRDITQSIHDVRDTNQNIHKNRDITQNVYENRDTTQEINNRDVTQSIHNNSNKTQPNYNNQDTNFINQNVAQPNYANYSVEQPIYTYKATPMNSGCNVVKRVHSGRDVTQMSIAKRNVTLPIYVQVPEEETIPYTPISGYKLEPLYNLLVPATAMALAQIAETKTVDSSTPTPTPTPMVQPSAFPQQAEPLRDILSECDELSFYAGTTTDDDVSPLRKLIETAEQEITLRSYQHAVFSASSTSESSIETASIPEMIEDAMEIISQDGDYMERIGLDERMQCVLCSWAGSKIVLEHHIRQEHASEIIQQTTDEWVVTYKLGTLVNQGLWLSHVCERDNSMYVLSVKYEDPDHLMASITTLSLVAEQEIGSITIYNKVTGEPYTWEGQITQIPSNMPYENNPDCFKVELSKLQLLPNSANLKLHNRELVSESPSKVVIGQPELNDIHIIIFVKIQNV